jgi:hypothetical protein
MNKVTRNLIKHLKQAEGFPELVDVTVRPTLANRGWLTTRLLWLVRSPQLAPAIKALQALIEEECEEGSIPAWCKQALQPDSGVEWDVVLLKVLGWK